MRVAAMEDESVPGMAEGVERRAAELGLSPSEFARRAGLTTAGLDPVRKGVRKNYAAKTRYGVARALRWPLDWYLRLTIGQDPATLPTVDHPPLLDDSDRLDIIEEALAEMREQIAEVVRRLDSGAPRPSP